MKQGRGSLNEIVGHVLGLSVEETFELIGEDRQRAEVKAVAAESSLGFGIPEDIRSLGRRIFVRLQRELFDVVCGKHVADKADREKLLSAIGLGEAAACAAITGFLISIGTSVLVAAAVASLLVRHVLYPTQEELCGAWQARVDKLIH